MCTPLALLADGFPAAKRQKQKRCLLPGVYVNQDKETKNKGLLALKLRVYLL
jgi:hypothetical protein